MLNIWNEHKQLKRKLIHKQICEKCLRVKQDICAKYLSKTCMTTWDFR